MIDRRSLVQLFSALPWLGRAAPPSDVYGCWIGDTAVSQPVLRVDQGGLFFGAQLWANSNYRASLQGYIAADSPLARLLMARAAECCAPDLVPVVFEPVRGLQYRMPLGQVWIARPEGDRVWIEVERGAGRLERHDHTQPGYSCCVEGETK
jgi:hypothetical protein